jgi:predicted glycoside hydrolase/deacetylase ChbG (UPF0249 family)
MPLSLIVTADDFGIGLQTSRGILRAHLSGPVTATSLMVVTGDHARASVPLLADAPTLDVGLHLVLTRCGEKPLIARQSSGLVDRDGEFFTNGKLWARAYLGRLDRAGVADEIYAQAALFQKLMGRAPDYVDGHHHSHQLPIVRQALMDVMAGDLLPRVTRTTVEAKCIQQKVSSVRLKRKAAHFLGKTASRDFANIGNDTGTNTGTTNGVWTNESFFGMLSPADLKRPFPWDHYLAALPDAGIIEWVVHPGLPDETLKARDDYNAQRVTELEALTHSQQCHQWEKFRSNLGRKSILHKQGPQHVGG